MFWVNEFQCFGICSWTTTDFMFVIVYSLSVFIVWQLFFYAAALKCVYVCWRKMRHNIKQRANGFLGDPNKIRFNELNEHTHNLDATNFCGVANALTKVLLCYTITYCIYFLSWFYPNKSSFHVIIQLSWTSIVDSVTIALLYGSI